MSQFSKQTYYEILEVPAEASFEEIHRAYQRAKNTYSPNSPALYSVFSPEEAEELLGLINEAYSVLGDVTRRREYDQRIQSLSSADPKITSLEEARKPSEETPVSEEDLPDFAIPEAQPTNWTEESSAGPAKKVETPLEEKIPGNMGKTRYSQYKIEPLFEEEIIQNEFFDGEFFQKVRVYKNLSLEKISEVTRIGKNYLIAVENNDMKSLPAKVFVRGFISQFARLLEIDDKKATDSYMKFYDTHVEEE